MAGGLPFKRKAPRDPVAEQLRDIARQGTATARIAHVFAFLLIVLFSLASLVALAGDALTHFIDKWQHGAVDIPAGISVAISTLLVPAMDFGMVYAASIIRLLRTRRAERSEYILHWVVIGVVVITEASTYIYMASVYERPPNLPAWAIIILRGFTSPFLAIYLSMARALPVTAKDILAQAELAAGTGVIRDVTEIANNPDAPLDDKMMLYDASAVMGDGDRTRLGKMISVAQLVADRSARRRLPAAISPGTLPAISPPITQVFEHPNVTRSNTPALARPDEDNGGNEPPENEPDPPRGNGRARPDDNRAGVTRSNVRMQPPNSGTAAASTAPRRGRPPKPTRADVGRTKLDREALRIARVTAADKILSADPAIGTRALARRIAMATNHRCSESTAQEIRAEITGRAILSTTAEAAREAADAIQS